MSPASRNQVSNTLLRALSDETFDAFKAHLEPVALPLRFKLAEPGRPTSWIYFPESGVASVVGRVGTNMQEIGLFGREGAGCLYPLLGSRSVTPYLILMQVAGDGFRVPVSSAIRLFQAEPDARDVFLRYINAYLIQLSQTSMANSQYNTVQRMARWFLMVHDRVEGDSIHLTHDFIATMLGVGRTGVTLALHALENAHVISTARKRITILDRDGLETMTRSVYGFAETEYRRLFDLPLDEPDHSNGHDPRPTPRPTPRPGFPPGE